MEGDGDRPGIESPGVVAALGRYRNRALLIGVVGACLLVAFVVAATIVQGRADRLERVGHRVDGTIVAVNPALRSAGNVHVAYVHENERRRTVVHLNDSSPRYDVGQSVTVVIDPEDPAHVSLPGETNQSRLTVLPMVFALVVGGAAVLIGTWMSVRVHRQRRLLQRHPWTRRRSEFRYRRDNDTGPAAVLLDEERVLVIASSLRPRIERSGVPASAAVEAAGDVAGYVVLRAPGSDVLLSARPPSRRRSRKRWAGRFASE